MSRLLLPFAAALAALLVPAGSAQAEDYDSMRVQLPANLANRLLGEIQAQLRRQFRMEPRMHGNTLVGHFRRQPNIVGASPGTGTIVIAFDPSTQQGMAVMSVLIVGNVYLANRLSDTEDMWRQPNRAQESRYRQLIFEAVLQAMQRTCRVFRDPRGFVCNKA